MSEPKVDLEGHPVTGEVGIIAVGVAEFGKAGEHEGPQWDLRANAGTESLDAGFGKFQGGCLLQPCVSQGAKAVRCDPQTSSIERRLGLEAAADS